MSLFPRPSLVLFRHFSSFTRRFHGLLFRRRSRHEFAERAPDQRTDTHVEVPGIQAHVEEIASETGHLDARVTALEETRGELRSLASHLRFGTYCS